MIMMMMMEKKKVVLSAEMAGSYPFLLAFLSFRIMYFYLLRLSQDKHPIVLVFAGPPCYHPKHSNIHQRTLHIQGRIRMRKLPEHD